MFENMYGFENPLETVEDKKDEVDEVVDKVKEDEKFLAYHKDKNTDIGGLSNKLFITSEERFENLNYFYSPSERRINKKISILLNIFACLFGIGFIYYGIRNFRLIYLLYFVIYFCIWDALLVGVDNFVCQILPLKKYKNITVEGRERELERIQSKMLYYRGRSKDNSALSLAEKIDLLFGKTNEKSNNNYRYYLCRQDEESLQLKILKVKEAQSKRKNINSKVIITDEYKEKLDYFRDLYEKFEMIIQNMDEDSEIKILIENVENCILKIIKALKKNSSFVEFIPSNFYPYFDELQKNIAVIEDLSEEKQVEYTEKFNSVVERIDNKVDEIISDYQEHIMEDMDIGLNMLNESL